MTKITKAWQSLKEFSKFLRRLAVKTLQGLPISSEFLGPPKGFYLTLHDWCAQAKADYSRIQSHYLEIYPIQQIVRSQPKTIDSKIHWQFRSQCDCKSLRAFVGVVPDGRVWAGNGDNIAVISPNDRLLADVSLEIKTFNPEYTHQHSIFRQLRLPPVIKLDQTIALLSAGGGRDIYFHWMFDVLPRIHLLRCSDIPLESIDHFLVNSTHQSFQKETLERVGIPQTKIMETCQHPHLKAKTLIVPSLVGIPGQTVPGWACNFLRSEFLEKQHNPQLFPSRRFYISRSKAQHRRVINEEEVIAVLEHFGFEPLALEGLSLDEQVLRFSSASMIVSPHGGGLTNIVFCQPGTRIIEFFAPNYVIPTYWALSHQIGLQYHYFLGEGEAIFQHEDIDKYLTRPDFVNALRQDILVNLNILRDTLKLAEDDTLESTPRSFKR